MGPAGHADLKTRHSCASQWGHSTMALRPQSSASYFAKHLYISVNKNRVLTHDGRPFWRPQPGQGPGRCPQTSHEINFVLPEWLAKVSFSC